jgi:hypothetical protein
MNKLDPCLMTKERPHRSARLIATRFLWEALWLGMWSWAIVGPLFVMWWAVSQFVDLPDLLSFPKGEALWLFNANGVLGIIFVLLWLRGYIRFAQE